MRIFKKDVRCQILDVRKFLASNIHLLTSVFLLSSCHDTIEYYKRGESYASEQINSGVNAALQCDGTNKDKSYCDDSATNREKQHQEQLAAEAEAKRPQPVAKIPQSQTPMQVSKGPISPEPEAIESKPVQPGGVAITPLQPEENGPTLSMKPIVSPGDYQTVKKKPAAKKPTKKKPVKKSVKKKPIKKPVKKKPQKPVEKPKEPAAVPAPAPEGPVVDKPLLPHTTDDMLGIDKILP